MSQDEGLYYLNEESRSCHRNRSRVCLPFGEHYKGRIKTNDLEGQQCKQQQPDNSL